MDDVVPGGGTMYRKREGMAEGLFSYCTCENVSNVLHTRIVTHPRETGTNVSAP